MSDVVGSVTAELILDSSGFTTGINSAIKQVDAIKNSFSNIGKSVSSDQFNSVVKSVESIATNFDKVAKSIEKANNEQERFKQKQKELNDIRVGEKLYKEYDEYKQKVRQAEEETIKLQQTMAKYEKNANFFNPIIEGAEKAIKALEQFESVAQTPFEKLVENANKARGALDKFHQAMSGKSTESNLNPIIENAQKATTVLKRMGETGKSTFEQITETAHKARSALSKFTESNSGKSLQTNLKPVIEDAQRAVGVFERLREESIKSNEAKAFQGVIDNAKKAVIALQQVQEQTSRVSTEFGKMSERMSATLGMSGLNPMLGNTSQQLSNVANATSATNIGFSTFNKTTESTKSKISTLNSTTGNGVHNVRTLGETYNTTSGSMNRFGNSTTNANSRLQQHWSQLYRVTSALHSLKVVLSTVSSMFIWTFGMSLWEATKQTISSKNEMTSYLEQMGKGTGDIRSFNSGLDETVSKFQKLNKYMIGETIAGIGMEFNLSTEEMKKSMEVVAMIQNEYVRAGRKESEASLAVKDILQGEFLRLSRETGVGKQDLIDTGKWQGDLKDVMGLMEALKKVGEDRHWDLFASKCRSLNDVISTTRNRISEFTATLIDELSPTIVGAFNMIIDVVDGATESFNNMGVFEKLLMGVGVFYALSTAIIMVAGDVNLLDIAMTGYSKSLLSTIFRVDVATVREYGLAKALLAKVSGLQASTVAEIGNARAIMTRLLGLDASIVKEYGLRTAIATAVAMKNMDTASTEANTIAQGTNTTMLDLSTLGFTMNSEATEANTIAKEINEGANLGVLRTLVMMVTGLDATTVAEMSATQAMWAFITSVTVLEALTVVGILAGVAVAFGTVAVQIQQTCERMKEYNDLIANSDDVIQGLKDAYKEMETERSNLDNQYYNGTLSAEEYNQKLKDLHLTTEDLTNASNELAEAIDNIDYAGKFSKTIENKKTLSALRSGTDLAKVMNEQGFDDTQIHDAKYYKSLVDFGNERLYKGLQVYNKQSSDFIDNEKELVKTLEKNQVPKEKQLDWVKDLSGAYADLQEHSYIANTSDDWWEGSWNHVWAGLDQMKINWINFWADFNLVDVISDKVGEFGQWSKDFDKQLGEFFKDPLGNFWEWLDLDSDMADWKGFEDWVNELLSNFDLGKLISDWFSGDGQGTSGGLVAKKINPMGLLKNIFGNVDVSWITEWFNNSVVKPFSDAVSNFVSDPLGFIADLEWNALDFIGKIFGGGEEFDARQWVQDTIVTPLSTALNEFLSDPLGYIGDMSWDILTFIGGLFGMDQEVIDFHTWVYETIGLPLKTELDLFFQDPLAYVGGLLGNIGTFLTSLLSGDTDVFTTMYTWVTDNIVTPFTQSIQMGLLSIPIIGDILAFLGLADSPEVQTTANEKGTNVGGSFGQAVENKIRSIPILGDILAWLGVIDGANPTANQKGHNVGQNIHDGVDNGKAGTADLVRNEMVEIISAIAGKVGEAYAQAQAIGGAILNGINSIIQHHSPGIPAQLIGAEMEEINLSMVNAYDSIYESAQNIGYAITNGIQPNTDINFDAEAMAQYQADTMMAMGMADETVYTTESAFSQLDMNTATTFSNIGTTIGTTMTNIANNTKLQYSNIALTTKTQLANMQSQTTKNIGAIKQSWTGMQVALIASAEHIRSETGAKIHSLQNNMATFWRKVQNPALLLGAGSPSEDKGRRTRYSSHTSGVRKILSPSGFAGSPTISRSNSNPRGARTGTGISDKLPNRTVNGIKIYDILTEYLECLKDGKPCYAGGWDFNWSDEIRQALLQWHTHFGEIYDPYLYVGKFENDNFPIRGIAPIALRYIEDAISRTSYSFYYDSRYSSPLEAWNAGSFNCYDGALVVMALASALGFPNSTMVHGSWNGIPHVWARIAGLGDIDATAIQGHYGLTAPSKYAGGDIVRPRFKHKGGSSDNNNGGTGDIHINIDLSGATVTDDSIGERIGRRVRDEIIDLISPNQATGY